MNKEDKVLEKLVEHDKRFDTIAKTLINHDNRLEIIEETMVTKKEFGDFRNETTDKMDEMITILKRLDQERIFTHEWVKRLEDDVKRNTKDIVKLKQVLKIA